ncbi:uncharacterized protein LOC128667291 [Microplitis demolitor]|uniref:uncharacterized protein LOC128667291 n=1 Tax=Microplitis demolitor TaxID=69319 RepID=UPI00235B6EA9|nr:uncharacterized protein LOC128667291 [Microplitis demolitor]XP_053592827.1 uncharacterized protein LOC128667291 [Microplitis demolitor]
MAMFVKNIAVSVFGTDYLKKHSVKGKGCNKTKSVPRPAIDSTKALAIRDIYEYYLKTEKNMQGSELQNELDNYEDYIRQKISDLIRPKRVPKTDGTKDSKIDKSGKGKDDPTKDDSTVYKIPASANTSTVLTGPMSHSSADQLSEHPTKKRNKKKCRSSM